MLHPALSAELGRARQNDLVGAGERRLRDQTAQAAGGRTIALRGLRRRRSRATGDGRSIDPILPAPADATCEGAS
jgi:hypothetical protein